MKGTVTKKGKEREKDGGRERKVEKAVRERGRERGGGRKREEKGWKIRLAAMDTTRGKELPF